MGDEASGTPLRLPGRPGGPDRGDRMRALGATCGSVLMAALAIAAVGTFTGAVLVSPHGRAGTVGAVPRTSLTPSVPEVAQSPRAGTLVAGVATTLPPRSRPSASPPRSAAARRAEARRQALVLDALLRRSNEGRRSLAVGLYRLDSCPRRADAGRAHVRAALDNRVRLLGQAAAADVDAVPDGARVRELLLRMWSTSRDADGDYLTWSATVGPGTRCAGDERLRAAADTRSRRARAAKREFVSVWNARVARPLGLATFTPGRL